MFSHQGGLLSVWFLIRLVFHQMVSHQSGLSSDGLIRVITHQVVCHQGGHSSDVLSSGWSFISSLIRMVFHQVVSHQGGLSSGGLIRVDFDQVVSHQVVSHQSGLSSGGLSPGGLPLGGVFHQSGLSPAKVVFREGCSLVRGSLTWPHLIQEKGFRERKKCS